MRKVIEVIEQVNCDVAGCGKEIDEEELLIEVEYEGVPFIINAHAKKGHDACPYHTEMALQLAMQKLMTKYETDDEV